MSYRLPLGDAIIEVATPFSVTFIMSQFAPLTFPVWIVNMGNLKCVYQNKERRRGNEKENFMVDF